MPGRDTCTCSDLPASPSDAAATGVCRCQVERPNGRADPSATYSLSQTDLSLPPAGAEYRTGSPDSPIANRQVLPLPRLPTASSFIVVSPPVCPTGFNHCRHINTGWPALGREQPEPAERDGSVDDLRSDVRYLIPRRSARSRGWNIGRPRRTLGRSPQLRLLNSFRNGCARFELSRL